MAKQTTTKKTATKAAKKVAATKQAKVTEPISEEITTPIEEVKVEATIEPVEETQTELPEIKTKIEEVEECKCLSPATELYVSKLLWSYFTKDGISSKEVDKVVKHIGAGKQAAVVVGGGNKRFDVEFSQSSFDAADSNKDFTTRSKQVVNISRAAKDAGQFKR